MARYPRPTNAHFRAAIDWLEANGWTINRDGTITRVKAETLPLIYDRGAMHKEPRYRILLNRNTCAIKPTDLVLAKFGRITDRFAFHPSNGRAVAAIEQPARAVVEPTASLSTETRTRPAGCGPAAIEQPDRAEVEPTASLSTETRTRPASRGPCRDCGGFMVRSDSDEWRCFQCGRTGMPPRVLSAEELKVFRRHTRMRAVADVELEELASSSAEIEELAQSSRV